MQNMDIKLGKPQDAEVRGSLFLLKFRRGSWRNVNQLYCPSFPTNMKPSLKLMRVGTSHLGSLPSSGHNNQVRYEIPRCRRELVSRSSCWRDGGSTFPYSDSNAWTIRRHWMSRSGSLRAAVESCGVSSILDHRYKDFSLRSLVCFTL